MYMISTKLNPTAIDTSLTLKIGSFNDIQSYRIWKNFVYLFWYMVYSLFYYPAIKLVCWSKNKCQWTTGSPNVNVSHMIYQECLQSNPGGEINEKSYSDPKQ